MTDAFTCSFCFSTFDPTTNPPRMLQCGHSFCTACIEKRLSESEETFLCLADSCQNPSFPLPNKSIEIFQINHALQKIIEMRTQKIICPIHEKKMKIVCLVDKCKVCQHCVRYGDHKGHETELMAKVIDNASKKTKSLLDGLTSLQEDCKQIENFHLEEKQAFLGEIQGWFKDLKALVNSKEQEAVSQVNKIFEAEGPRMREIAGFSGEYEKMVEEKIDSLKNIVNDQSGVDLLRDNEMEKTFVLAREKLVGYKAEFAGKLERSSSYWKESLLGVTKSVEGIEFSLRNLGESARKSRVKEEKENWRGDVSGILRSESLNI